jgi:hypothetical protein
MAKKKDKKQGRGRRSRIDMSTEAGRLLLHDMINYEKSGYNPSGARRAATGSGARRAR